MLSVAYGMGEVWPKITWCFVAEPRLERFFAQNSASAPIPFSIKVKIYFFSCHYFYDLLFYSFPQT